MYIFTIIEHLLQFTVLFNEISQLKKKILLNPNRKFSKSQMAGINLVKIC